MKKIYMQPQVENTLLAASATLLLSTSEPSPVQQLNQDNAIPTEQY